MPFRLCAIGDLTVDYITGPLTDFPTWGEEIEVTGINRQLGGNVGNMVKVASALGIEVTSVAPVGDDADGRFICDAVMAAGQPVGFVASLPAHPTSVTIALVREDGERSFITLPGALGQLTQVFEQGPWPEADCYFLSGWCQPPRVSARVIGTRLRQVRAGQGKVAMDLSWSADSWQRIDEVIAALSMTDLALMNETEALTLTGSTSVFDAIPWLRDRLGNATTIVVKRGASGAVAQVGRQQPIVVPAPEIVSGSSTVGAGDAFNTALLAAHWGDGKPIAVAMEYAANFVAEQLKTMALRRISA